MYFLVKARTLLLIVLFAAATPHAEQTPERRKNSAMLAPRARGESDNRHATSSVLMSSDDRLLVVSAALGRQVSRSKPDCSHLVHEIYSRAGFPYRYSSSSDLYSGLNEFQRVTTPQVADLIVWPGHVGIIVSPAQHSFYSSLRSRVGVDFYDSSYWRGRGRPRFYRYVKRTLMAESSKRDQSVEDIGAEEKSDSSTVLETANFSIMDTLAVDSMRLSPEQIRNAFLKLSNDYGDSLRTQDLSKLRVPLVVFDQIKVERLKVKGKKGTVDIRIDGPLTFSDGQLDQKNRHDRQRWTINNHDQTTWQLDLPKAVIYISRDDAARLFAQQLARITDGTHDESPGLKLEKAELARTLDVLLAE
ncbi:MAG: hypothetical protein DMG86_01220 [Acidobacteria bacterium]|nr:MAG: hypothetical protein DMG86_01220 [Acidobacteriota bacterium]PYX12936.1 MAG: hypothetical protein DMG85_00935 [Acidobacteriota bacterium]PYX15173.1 MAG: hypothetical protein DMG84_12520 [Acidobacteriota bacterium]